MVVTCCDARWQLWGHVQYTALKVWRWLYDAFVDSDAVCPTNLSTTMGACPRHCLMGWSSTAVQDAMNNVLRCPEKPSLVQDTVLATFTRESSITCLEKPSTTRGECPRRCFDDLYLTKFESGRAARKTLFAQWSLKVMTGGCPRCRLPDEWLCDAWGCALDAVCLIKFESGCNTMWCHGKSSTTVVQDIPHPSNMLRCPEKPCGGCCFTRQSLKVVLRSRGVSKMLFAV